MTEGFDEQAAQAFLKVLSVHPTAYHTIGQLEHVTNRVEDASEAIRRGKPMTVTYDTNKWRGMKQLQAKLVIDGQFITGMEVIRRGLR